VTATVILAALVSAAPAAAEQPGSKAMPVTDAGTLPEALPRSSRLKFRSSGPVCMCVGGLGEADITAAERAREDPGAELQDIIQDP